MKTIKLITLSIIFGILFFSIVNLSSALIIQSVSNSPDRLIPGQTGTIDLVIKNDAEDDITDVSVSLDLTNVPLAPSTTGSDYSADELLSGRIKEVEFKVIALNDAKSGIYKIPIKIAYTQNEVVKTKQSLVSVTIQSDPIISVMVEDSLLLKGKENKMSLKVINKGLGDAKFLEIDVKKSSLYYSLLTQEIVYIGDVDSNDFQTADFQVFFNQNTPNKVVIPVTVKYKDVYNKEYSYDSNIELRVYNIQDATNLGLIQQNNLLVYVIVIVIVLVVVIILFRVFRRRKQPNE